MTIAKEAVYALHQRLKDLSINAPRRPINWRTLPKLWNPLRVIAPL